MTKLNQKTHFYRSHGVSNPIMRASFLFSAIVLANSSPSFAQSPTYFKELQNLQKKGARVSAMAWNLSSGKLIADLDSAALLTPASTTKLLIAEAALSKFGSEFTVKSRLTTTGNVVCATTCELNGNLTFEGNGDAYLTNEKLWYLASDVKRRGILKINGELLIDDSSLSFGQADSNRKNGEEFSSHAYDSPLSAAAVNFSVFAVVASPNPSGKGAAILDAEPYLLPFQKLINKTQTVLGSKSKLEVLRASQGSVKNGNYSELITVSGVIGTTSEPVRSYKSVGNAKEYTKQVLKSFLEREGVTFQNTTISSTKNSKQETWIVSSVDSYPLDYQLQGLFKMSNNFIADMLTAKLGENSSLEAKNTLQAGNFELEERANTNLGKFLEKFKEKKIEKIPKAKVFSGSGLTPENRISSLHLISLLESVYSNAAIFPSFLNSLPKIGGEGTLKKRFSNLKDINILNSLRAKTGTLTEPTEAVSLAGFAKNALGEWIAFATIVNGSKNGVNLGVNTIRDAIDRDVVAILD